MIVQVTNSTDSEYTNLMTGQRLVDTYAEIVRSNRVMDELKEDLDLNMSNGTIRGLINVRSVSDTLIIKLSVSCVDPVKARDIANQIVLIVKDLSVEFEGLEDVEILDIAELPTSPSGPNHILHIMIGTVLGGMTGVGLIVLLDVLDTKVKSTKDLEQKVGIRLLGVIPNYHMDEEEE